MTTNTPYVCVAVGSTAPNREFKPYLLEPILRFIKSTGRVPVIMGSKETHAGVQDKNGVIQPRTVKYHYDNLPEDVRGFCLDMRDKTTLETARDLIGYADAIVGLDGGLLHLAGTTQVPIVYGLTHVRPAHRSIWRNGSENYRLKHVTPRDLGCAGCQSNWTLVFGHQFTDCAYDDFKCTEQLDPQDFINALTEVML